MKKLEISQMENLQGGLECSTGLGLTTGLYVGGLILAGTGVGAGFGLLAIGAAGYMAAGYNCHINH